ncbi:MAG: phosphoribosylformylglycinamidine synthase subunit PurL [Anaerolineales bacterium]|nr:phosphoribosylformylglycinamidine synthase subunit PurL [Anaerolineales bacterium]
MRTDAIWPVHTLVVRTLLKSDPTAEALLSDAHALGLKSVRKIERELLYFLEGKLAPAEREQLRTELLTDPIVQTGAWRDKPAKAPAGAFVIEVALRPGVTDPVAEEIVRCAQMLDIKGVQRAATGTRYIIRGALSPKQRTMLARRLLANDVIQRFTIGQIEPVFPHPAESSGQVERLPIRKLDDRSLSKLNAARLAALDPEEMRAIQAWYIEEDRDPTDVEFEMIAQTWSEHCGHKTFKADITVAGEEETIEGLLDTYIRAATDEVRAGWVRSAFVDNAGIIDFDGGNEVSFKVETHNHPSAIEPFGGANTGTGGVIRDILGVSAKPIASTDVLCFGPADANPDKLPEGVLHPRRIRSGVVAGIQDYGNKIGIPTVSGAIWYDPAYTANPLVYCGCVGIAPKGKHVRSPKPGDHIILLGGKTGRDGLRGATFSSMTMDAKTGEVSGASVQIGDPITEKGLIEVIVRARNKGLYHAVTDCGAGGLSSAVGEMGSRIGFDVELREVPLKYAGLAPWEIWLSEAQERMVLAVPTDKLVELRKICKIFDVSLTDIGRFTNDKRAIVRYNGITVLDLENHFLHEGQPVRKLKAVLPKPVETKAADAPRRPKVDNNAVLLKLLAHPNIATKAETIHVYDYEVQAGTSVKPLTGIENDGPSDAVVLVPAGAKGSKGIVLSVGFNPEIGKVDPYRMALSVIDEAVRNAVAVGANPDRISLLDNFCFGDPLRPEVLGTLVAACRGCYDAALTFKLPFISGKDSLNNEYIGSDGRKQAIPPSLLISGIGIVDDVFDIVTMDLKAEGSTVYLIGETRDEMGGSHFHLVQGGGAGEPAPDLPAFAPALYRCLHTAIRKGLVLSCHDLSEGGLAVAAAEMCIAGRLGMLLDLDDDDTTLALFGESNSRFLVEVESSNAIAFETCFTGGMGNFARRLGNTVPGRRLTISTIDETLLSISVDDMVKAWKGNVK